MTGIDLSKLADKAEQEKTDIKGGVDLNSSLRRMSTDFIRACERAGSQEAIMVGIDQAGRLVIGTTFTEPYRGLGVLLSALLTIGTNNPGLPRPLRGQDNGDTQEEKS